MLEKERCNFFKADAENYSLVEAEWFGYLGTGGRDGKLGTEGSVRRILC